MLMRLKHTLYRRQPKSNSEENTHMSKQKWLKTKDQKSIRGTRNGTTKCPWKKKGVPDDIENSKTKSIFFKKKNKRDLIKQKN